MTICVIQYLYKGGALLVLQEQPSVTHMHLGCSDHFGLGKLSNFPTTIYLFVSSIFVNCLLYFNSEYSPGL